MRRLRSSSEAEMVALVLRTELPAARFRDKLRALLDQAGLPERLITAPNLDDPAENQARERLLTQHREYGTRAGLFDGFPRDVCWEWMAITPAELATVRYVDYDYWVELSGGTRLAVDAAPRIRAGAAPFGVSSDWALGMAREVARGARFRVNCRCARRRPADRATGCLRAKALPAEDRAGQWPRTHRCHAGC